MKSELDEKTIGGVTYALRKPPSGSGFLGMFRNVVVSVLSAPLLVPWAFLMATPLRDTLLGMIIPRVMNVVDKEFHKERETLLADVSGKVLDIGSGGGAYLKYCKAADEVVAVEPMKTLHERIREAGKDLKKLTIVDTLDDLPDNASFDWAIFGNVSVPNFVCYVASIANRFSLSVPLLFR